MGEYFGATYEYDADGNLARRREAGELTWLYGWDAAGRLKEARRYARPPAAHEVDHHVRTADSVRFVPGNVQPEVTVLLRYDAFGRRTLKARTRHATYFYQNDHLGTPQEGGVAGAVPGVGRAQGCEAGQWGGGGNRESDTGAGAVS
ncbi:YD repeat-containing protein [Paraburkholderia hospita]|nr:YD repeat-containing protein [Paraburkholderia hospita]